LKPFASPLTWSSAPAATEGSIADTQSPTNSENCFWPIVPYILRT
jgi:hypothetical protein